MNNLIKKQYSGHYCKVVCVTIDFIETNERIGEFGHGAGLLAAMIPYFKNIQYIFGMDIKGDLVEMLSRKMKIHEMLFYNFDLEKQWPKLPDFDVAIMSEVLEHLNDDISVIRKLKNKNIVFSVPNFQTRLKTHKRWFESVLDVKERYEKYIKFEKIKIVKGSGKNKWFIVRGKIRNKEWVQ